MQEIEVKILEIDATEVQRKLEALGAREVFRGIMQASLYDFGDGRLGDHHSFVRLRTKGSTEELVFKERVSIEGAQHYNELEIEVSSRGTASLILEKLGLQETVHGRSKHRISYSIEDVHFEIDTIEGMPTFLEIEVIDLARLEYWVNVLGYTMAETKSWSGKDVYEHYGIEYPRVS